MMEHRILGYACSHHSVLPIFISAKIVQYKRVKELFKWSYCVASAVQIMIVESFVMAIQPVITLLCSCLKCHPSLRPTDDISDQAQLG